MSKDLEFKQLGPSSKRMNVYEVFLVGKAIGRVVRELVVWYPMKKDIDCVPTFQTRHEAADWLVAKS